MVHPSQTLSTQWDYYPSTLTGDPYVEAVRQELVYAGYPDCVFVLFSSDMTVGYSIYYDFPVIVHSPLRLRVFARSGDMFSYLGQFTYRLVVETYSASNTLLQQWSLIEGVHFPHYQPSSNSLPLSPNLIPMVTLTPSSPWKRLRLTAYIDGWTWPGSIMPPEATVNDPRWSELTVSYIEAEAAFGERRLRIRPMVGASV